MLWGPKVIIYLNEIKEEILDCFIAGLEGMFLQFLPGLYGRLEMVPAQALTSS